LKGDYVQENLKAFGNEINIRQILIGLTVLFLGTLVYLIDRSPDQTYFVHKSFVNISLHNTLPNLFGFIGNNLPSLIHVFSFILITAGLISYRKKSYLIICLAWFLIDCAFEFGQKFNSLVPKIIPDWLIGIPFLENTENYFVHGTFDYFDLLAIIIGSLIAYFVLLATMEKEKSKK
jgi:hypothetical protein